MFDNLRRALREAVDNFNRELNRDNVPEAVSRLLSGMRDEVTEAKTRLHDLETAIRKARAEATGEQEQIATCERREAMALEIGDEETAQIAREYAARHTERRDVLRQKATALEAELKVRRAEIDEMLEKIREAQRNRDILAASAGRSSARDSIRESNDLFEELDRMAERIERHPGATGDPLEDIDLSGPDLGIDIDAPPPPAVDFDERLRQLKERMGGKE